MHGNVQLLLRAAALGGTVVALRLWDPAGYGWTFWLWILSAAALALSLPGRSAAVVPAPIRWSTGAGLLALLAFAAAIRLPRIHAVPANISVDELLPTIEAMGIAAGSAPNVFSSVGWFTIPNLTFALPAVVMTWLPGDAFLAIRLSSVPIGLAGIVGTFLLARRLFGDRVALGAAFLMAAGFWHLHNSRTGFPFVQTSFAVSWVLYFLVRARQDHSLRAMFVAGLALGLALQLYFPVRALLLLVPMFLLTGWWLRRDSWRRWWQDTALLAGGALITLGPLLGAVPLETLAGRSQGILLTQPAVFANLARIYQTEETLTVVTRNFEESFGMLTEWADVCILNRSPGGLFDGVTLTGIGLGFLYALLRLQPQAVLLVAWVLAVFVLGVALTDAPRASYRLGPAMPAFYILAAYGFDRLLTGDRPLQGRYQQAVALLVVFATAAWVATTNHRLFFVDYAQKGHGRAMPHSAALRFAGERCDGRMVYYVADPEPLGSDDLVGVFCSDYRGLDIASVPNAVDPERQATFIVMPWQVRTLARLRECYPGALVMEQNAEDGRLMFVSADVERDEVASGPERCLPYSPEEEEADADLKPKAAARERAEPAPASPRRLREAEASRRSPSD